VTRGQHFRKYPEPKVADRIGVYTVTRALGRGRRGRSDLSFEVTCACGQVQTMFECRLHAAGFGAKCSHKKAKRFGSEHRLYDSIEMLTRDQRRVLFDRLLDNFCFDTGTHDGKPCGEFADEPCMHNLPSAKAVSS
jgi:hypothetical protein